MNLVKIYSARQRINNSFSRADSLEPDSELLSDISKYICIVSLAYLGESVYYLYPEFAKGKGSKHLIRFVEKNVPQNENFNWSKLMKFLAYFDENWQIELEQHDRADRFKDSLNTLYGWRNQLAHGRDVNISYVDLKDHFNAIVEIVDVLADQCKS